MVERRCLKFTGYIYLPDGNDNYKKLRNKYLLSKNSVKHIVDLYFDRNTIPPNTTIDTQQHKQHKTPQNKVLLGGVCGIMPEVPLPNPCVKCKKKQAIKQE